MRLDFHDVLQAVCAVRPVWPAQHTACVAGRVRCAAGHVCRVAGVGHAAGHVRRAAGVSCVDGRVGRTAGRVGSAAGAGCAGCALSGWQWRPQSAFTARHIG